MKTSIIGGTVLVALLVATYLGFVQSTTAQATDKIPLSILAEKIQEKQIESITIRGNNIEAVLKNGTHWYSNKEGGIPLSESLLNFGVSADELRNVMITEVNGEKFSSISAPIIFFLPVLLGPLIIAIPIAVAIWLMFRLLNIKIGRQWITLVVGLVIIAIILRSSDLTFYNKSTDIDRGADWLTYRNEKFGFEIKYPPDWTFSSPGLMGVVEFCGLEGFADPDDPKLGCEIRERTNAMSDTPRSMASIFLFINTKDFNKPQNCTKITTDNGIEIFDCGDVYYWQRGNYFFEFATGYGFSSDPENKAILDKMLSTFRFLESEAFLPTTTDEEIMLYLKNITGFGYGVESISEIKKIEDIDKDGFGEFLIKATGSGGTCVGGTNYTVLYSPKNQEYFIAAKSILNEIPAGNEKMAFCPTVKPYFWEGCGETLEFICFSNNLKDWNNVITKKYLEILTTE